MATTSTAKLEKGQMIAIVTPNTKSAREMGYAKVNNKVIPFGIQCVLDEQDYKALSSMFEAERVSGGADVYAIMEQLKIPQEKANKIARESDGMDGQLKMRKVKTYNISIIKKAK